MEGSAGYHFKDQHLFFILGASDDLMENLRKTAVRISMRGLEHIKDLRNMPISQFMDLVEDIIEADEEMECRREEIRRRKRGQK